MSRHDARRALDDIRRYGDSALDAYVRHNFAPSYAAALALMLFAVFVAIDLPSPWRGVLTAAGLVIGLGAMCVGHYRAPVRRRPSVMEIAVCLAWAIVLILVYSVARIGAYLLGLPVPGVVAAGVLAVVSCVVLVAIRPLYRSLLRRADRQG